MSFELHHAIRAQCLRGVLKAVNDNGADQIVDLELHAGQLRCGVPKFEKPNRPKKLGPPF